MDAQQLANKIAEKYQENAQIVLNNLMRELTSAMGGDPYAETPASIISDCLSPLSDVRDLLASKGFGLEELEDGKMKITAPLATIPKKDYSIDFDTLVTKAVVPSKRRRSKFVSAVVGAVSGVVNRVRSRSVADDTAPAADSTNVSDPTLVSSTSSLVQTVTETVPNAVVAAASSVATAVSDAAGSLLPAPSTDAPVLSSLDTTTQDDGFPTTTPTLDPAPVVPLLTAQSEV